MSLQDGTSKMSKSDPNDNSRINLMDSADTIQRKIKRCKTDDSMGLEWDNPARPECTNLLKIYQAVTGMTREEVLTDVGELSWGGFKPRLADAVVDHLGPIQTRYAEVMEDRTYLHATLREGAEQADEIASATLDAAKKAMGITSLRDFA